MSAGFGGDFCGKAGLFVVVNSSLGRGFLGGLIGLIALHVDDVDVVTETVFKESFDDRKPLNEILVAEFVSMNGSLGLEGDGGSGDLEPGSIAEATLSGFSEALHSKLFKFSPLISFFIDFILDDMHRKTSCGLLWSNMKTPSPLSHFLPASNVNLPSRYPYFLMNLYGHFEIIILKSSMDFNCSSVTVKCSMYVFASKLHRLEASDGISVTKNNPSPYELQYKSLSSSIAVEDRVALLELLSRKATDWSAVTHSFKSSSVIALRVSVSDRLTIWIKLAGDGSCVIFTQFSKVIIFGFLSSRDSHISNLSIP